MNDSLYFSNIKKVQKKKDKKNFIYSGFSDWKLYFFDLEEYGYPIKIYYKPSAVFHVFINKIYYYKNESLGVKNGDYVIDAGACWGDTALYFANSAGENGKVFSFKFLPENINIFNKNISLNNNLQKRIKLIEKPLWSESDVEIFCNNSGPGNSIVGDKTSGKSYKTTTIDDFVKKNQIKKIDFIKMDIEGSELHALKGAEKTLKEMKPVLSISSIYHKNTDFKDIPEFIDSLKLNYIFYFDHYSIHNEKTVLFARAK